MFLPGVSSAPRHMGGVLRGDAAGVCLLPTSMAVFIHLSKACFFVCVCYLGTFDSFVRGMSFVPSHTQTECPEVTYTSISNVLAYCFQDGGYLRASDMFLGVLFENL